MSDKMKRQKRAVKTRASIARLKKVRLSVHRSTKHMEAQLIAPDGKVLAYISTKGSAFKKLGLKSTGNIDAAVKLGQLIAKASAKLKIVQVAFDRSGFRYHGRVKALAEAAREGGLDF